MADEDSVVLRLLREIRAEQETQGTRLVKVERQLSEMKESMFTAMGMAGHSYNIVEKSGDRFDELTDEIAALKRRVQDLEARQ